MNQNAFTIAAPRASRLALGTVQFGQSYGVANTSGQVRQAEAASMLTFAAANGVDTLDTAVSYGESESCLGRIGVKGFRLITKLPPIPANVDDLSTWAFNELNASLKRLHVTNVYGLLLHQPTQLLGPQGTKLYKALQSLKDRGMTQKTGISIYAPEELAAIAATYPLDIVQAPFNLVDRRLETSGWLARLKDRGAEVHTRSVYLQGLLLMQREKRPKKFSRWEKLWDRWSEWIERSGADPVQACLSFVLAHKEIDRVLVGSDNLVQLTQTIEAALRPQLQSPELRCDDVDLVNPSRWNDL